MSEHCLADQTGDRRLSRAALALQVVYDFDDLLSVRETAGIKPQIRPVRDGSVSVDSEPAGGLGGEVFFE